jgi:hypothetical protein
LDHLDEPAEMCQQTERSLTICDAGDRCSLGGATGASPMKVAGVNAPSVWQPKKVRELTPIFASAQ